MKFGVNTITCSKVIEIFVLGGDDLSPPGLDRVNRFDSASYLILYRYHWSPPGHSLCELHLLGRL